MTIAGTARLFLSVRSWVNFDLPDFAPRGTNDEGIAGWLAVIFERKPDMPLRP